MHGDRCVGRVETGHIERFSREIDCHGTGHIGGIYDDATVCVSTVSHANVVLLSALTRSRSGEWPQPAGSNPRQVPFVPFDAG